MCKKGIEHVCVCMQLITGNSFIHSYRVRLNVNGIFLTDFFPNLKLYNNV